MTSDTSPSGKVFYSSVDYTYGADRTPYQAFDGNEVTMGHFKVSVGGYIGYEFAIPTMVAKMYLNQPGAYECNYILQGSNDGNSWDDLTSEFTNNNANNYVITNCKYYKKYRIYQSTSCGGAANSFYTIQFYGRSQN